MARRCTRFRTDGRFVCTQRRTIAIEITCLTKLRSDFPSIHYLEGELSALHPRKGERWFWPGGRRQLRVVLGHDTIGTLWNSGKRHEAPIILSHTWMLLGRAQT